MDYHSYLSGGDLRSIGKSGALVNIIKTQREFDELFKYLKSKERLIAMRAADVVEKITATNREFLASYADDILNLAEQNVEKEVKWHLAQLIPRLTLDQPERSRFYDILLEWLKDPRESKIVRANAFQSLFTFAQDDKALYNRLQQIIDIIKDENIPSLHARIRSLWPDANVG